MNEKMMKDIIDAGEKLKLKTDKSFAGWGRGQTNVLDVAKDTDYMWSTNNVTVSPDQTLSNEVFELKREINNLKLEMDHRLFEMDEQILLVRRDTILENEFEELKEAWKTYETLLDKLKTFKALKDSV